MILQPPDYFANGPDSFARRCAFISECSSWVGTPFRARSCIKGPQGGVDCAGYVGTVFAAIGAIEGKIAVPPYELNHAEHCDESLLRGWFEQPEVRARVRALDEGEPLLIGDMVFPKIGRTEHHLALWVGGEIYHVVRPGGVCRQSLAGLALYGVMLHRARYRLMEPAT